MSHGQHARGQCEKLQIQALDGLAFSGGVALLHAAVP